MIQVSNKYYFKLTFAIIIALVLVTNFSVSSTALAQTDKDKPKPIEKITEKSFCAQLDSINNNLDNLINQKINNLNTKQVSRVNKVNETFNKRDSELNVNRIKWDANREEQYKKMYENAKTDAQKQAIDQFKLTMNNAIILRRTKIDSAISTFRSTINTELSGRQSAVNSVITNYQNTLDAVQTKAKTSCENGDESSQVRQALKTDIQLARADLQSGRSGIDRINDEVTNANNIRKNAIEAAITEFRTTAQQARETLSQAIKN